MESIKQVGPAGSCLVSIGDVIDQRISQLGPETEFLYLDIGSVDRETKQLFGIKTVALHEAPSRAKQVVAAGDVLVSMTRPNLNAVAIVPLSAEGAIASTGFQVLRSRWVETKFLHYLVQTDAFIDAMSMVVQGALYPAIRPKDIAGFEFFLPPTAEQTRIVEKLEELLSDVDTGMVELKAAQRKLVQYRQSLLKAMVQGTPSGSTSRIPEFPLGELVQSIGQGWSPRCEPESVDGDADWAVIKTTAIQPLAFDGSHNKKLPSALNPREHLELKVGDLLITRAGPRSRVGITCLVREVKKRLILCDKAYRIRCDASRIDKEFLELVLNAPHVVNSIDELKSGINDSGLNLTQDRFFTLMIPVPTLDQQRVLVEHIHTQLQCIQAQELAIETSLRQSTAQRKNILKTAFSGQLVAQDPNDEPASALLQRIRAERASGTTTISKRDRKPRITT